MPNSCPSRAIVLGLFSTLALFFSGTTILAHDTDVDSARAFGAIHPRLSPSGETIVFSYQGALWRMPRGGGVMTQLTDGAGFDIEPVFSPDGKRIAFIRSRDFRSGQVKVVRTDDGAPVKMPRNVRASEKLYFHPDGRRLLGNFQEPGQQSKLAWLDLQTGELGERLVPPKRRQKVALSHDGRSIVLATTQDVVGEQGGNNGPAMDLWKAPSSGGTPQRLAQFPARIHDLCFSADDQSVLVVTELGGVHYDLWRLPLNDPLRGATKLTYSQADEDRPSVSADGRWLLYTDNRRGATQLMLHDVAAKRDTVLEATRREFKRPFGEVEVRVVDRQTGEPTTARVSLRHEGGQYHAPPGSLYRLLRGDLHFYAHDHVHFRLPEGTYQLKAARGPEYRVARRTVNIQAGKTTEVTVEIERWTDQRSAGWYSGESHIHANYGYGHWYNTPRSMRLQCSGEELIVCNFMVANSDGDGVFDREFFRGKPDPLSTPGTILYWNEEFRSTIWGHMTLLNLKQLVTPIYTGFAHTTHPHDHVTNADIADHTHDQDGLVNYTHPVHSLQDPYATAYAAKEMPIDVALGKIDSMDVMGSNHAANLPIWYKLLNCGFQVPASAGTDCFLNRINSRLPGGDRVYVRVEGEFNYERWIEGLRAGRTFVTNCPMFEFTVDGKPAGETISRGAPGRVRVQGAVKSLHPLDKVEVVSNGQVVGEANINGDGRTVPVDIEIPIERSGWIALRASGPPHEDLPRGYVYGHTSPVYVKVEGRPVQAGEEARFFLKWIDRLWDDVRKRNRIPVRHHPHVEKQIAAASAVYKKLAEAAP